MTTYVILVDTCLPTRNEGMIKEIKDSQRLLVKNNSLNQISNDTTPQQYCRSVNEQTQLSV